MSTTPWSTLATTLWTPAGIYLRAMEDGVQFLIGATSAQNRDTIVQNQINQMTDDYRQRLILRLRKTYPDTAKALVTLANQKMEAYRRLAEHAGDDLRSDDSFSVDGFQYFSIKDAPEDFDPEYFLVTDPPGSSTLAGQADNGDFVICRSNTLVYINRGTKAAPVWSLYTADSLIDYITNPQELVEAGYNRAVANCYGYGELNDNGSFGDNLEKISKAADRRVKLAEKKEATAFDLITIDRSADGVLSSSERDSKKSRKFFF